MKLRDIAINNLRRRKGKTALTLLTFLLVVGTTVTINTISSGLNDAVQKQLSAYGANIVISPRTEHLALSYGGLSIPGVTYNVQLLDSTILEKLTGLSDSGEINGIAPKVIGSVSGGAQKYLLVGVDFAAESKMKTSFKIQGTVPGPEQVVIGSRLSARDRIKAGDKLLLGGRPVTISEVLQESGSSSDLAVYTNIGLARQLTGLGNTFNLVEVSAKNPQVTAPAIARLLPGAKVALVSQLVQGSAESIGRFKTFAVYITILMALTGTLVVAVTLAGNINDRTRELGIFRAIGFRQKHVLGILLTEVLLVSTAGGLGGYLLGITAPLLIGRAITGQNLSFAWNPLLGIGAVVFACFIGVTAIAYSAWRALRLDPAEALRFI